MIIHDPRVPEFPNITCFPGMLERISMAIQPVQGSKALNRAKTKINVW